MFKNMIVYRIAESWQGDLQLLEDALQKTVFEECGTTQERSVGWVPPRGEDNGAMVESACCESENYAGMQAVVAGLGIAEMSNTNYLRAAKRVVGLL